MKKLTLFLIIPLSLGIFLFGRHLWKNLNRGNGAPPYTIEDLRAPEEPYSWLSNWKRPEGAARVGLQVGHWKASEVPEELHRLQDNTGSSSAGKAEWEVNLTIAESTSEILREKGIQVDILPTTIPPQYWADVFISIHADGSTDPSKSGFKAASPRRDYSGKASKLLAFIEEEYESATDLPKDPNITRNMRGYYAFAWWRYEHSVHPMTASAILETGFLTSPNDRKIIVSNPRLPAQGLALGIIKFLESENLVEN